MVRLQLNLIKQYLNRVKSICVWLKPNMSFSGLWSSFFPLKLTVFDILLCLINCKGQVTLCRKHCYCLDIVLTFLILENYKKSNT